MSPSQQTRDRAAATENARRLSRFHYAEKRIRKIAEGAPPLTAEQRAHLAAILLTADRPVVGAA